MSSTLANVIVAPVRDPPGRSPVLFGDGLIHPLAVLPGNLFDAVDRQKEQDGRSINRAVVQFNAYEVTCRRLDFLSLLNASNRSILLARAAGLLVV